jgi:hypothetical protein
MPYLLHLVWMIGPWLILVILCIFFFFCVFALNDLGLEFRRVEYHPS